MKKVKITVLKTTFDATLAAEYGAPGLGKCPMLREGQIFYADYAKPDGFCDEAGRRFISTFSRSHTIFRFIISLIYNINAGINKFYEKKERRNVW